RSERTMDLENESDDSFARREFSYHTFQRSFSLDNEMVDESKITAKYEDGILRVHLPKKEEAKVQPSKKIDIS
ncbi:MAG: Hsp20/alpha crystallin family protein, partial [Saprospiraceae bacterium]|nr:Hsp20/alpha crystallin family protein [Saprospiraceae bacterium]